MVRCWVGRASAKGRPPTGGWWWEYHQFSTVFTTGPPPLSRSHSARRAGTESPSAGDVSASPSETHTGVRSTNSATVPVVRGWRPGQVRRERRSSLRTRPPLTDVSAVALPGRPMESRRTGFLRTLRAGRGARAAWAPSLGAPSCVP